VAWKMGFRGWRQRGVSQTLGEEKIKSLLVKASQKITASGLWILTRYQVTRVSGPQTGKNKKLFGITE